MTLEAASCIRRAQGAVTNTVLEMKPHANVYDWLVEIEYQ